jgi:hypothetical protein
VAGSRHEPGARRARLAAFLALAALPPTPDRLMVLPDASTSHATFARPLLLKYKFGATFFVAEG